jgi:hypothetical protein
MTNTGKITISPTRNREEADDYRRVVVVLNSDWRLIECRDDMQWILQRRSGKRRGQPRWVSRKYNRNKQALICNVHAIAGEIAPAVREVLVGLPDWIEVRP